VIVVDASAALSALFNDGTARRVVATVNVQVPHLIDSEIASGVRSRVRSGQLAPDVGWRLIETWSRLGVNRHPIVGVLDRIWELRDNLSAYDAGYVALAEALGCDLLTADRRLAGASGVRCPITVVP